MQHHHMFFSFKLVFIYSLSDACDFSIFLILSSSSAHRDKFMINSLGKQTKKQQIKTNLMTLRDGSLHKWSLSETAMFI